MEPQSEKPKKLRRNIFLQVTDYKRNVGEKIVKNLIKRAVGNLLLRTSGIGNVIVPILPAINPAIGAIRKRIYDTVTPYDTYNVGEAIKNITSGRGGYKKAVKWLLKEPGDRFARLHALNVSDALLAKYLNIPKNQRHSKVLLIENPDGSVSLPLLEADKETLISVAKNPTEEYISGRGDLKQPGLKPGLSKFTREFDLYGMGVNTVSNGVSPDKGDYVEYYDTYDLNPFNGKYDGHYIPFISDFEDASMGIGNPFNIRGRVYLDDYYGVNSGVNKEDYMKNGTRYGGYLPEVEVIDYIPKGKSGIHIKKKNRGKFTLYCGGNVTSSCIARAKASGNPTLKKRAIFAENARKWHKLGGIIKTLPKYLGGGELLTSSYEIQMPGHRKIVLPSFGNEEDIPNPVENLIINLPEEEGHVILPTFDMPGGSTTSSSSDSSSFTGATGQGKEGDLDKTISEILTEEGIKHRVTSGYRAGSAHNHGKKDAKGNSMAMDIVPTDGDFDRFRKELYSNSRVVAWLLSHKWGILEELAPGGYIDADSGKYVYTKSTGKHFHFGPDSSAIRYSKKHINYA